MEILKKFYKHHKTWNSNLKTRFSILKIQNLVLTPQNGYSDSILKTKTSEWILQAWFLILEFGVKTVHLQLSGVVEEFF